MCEECGDSGPTRCKPLLSHFVISEVTHTAVRTSEYRENTLPYLLSLSLSSFTPLSLASLIAHIWFLGPPPSSLMKCETLSISPTRLRRERKKELLLFFCLECCECISQFGLNNLFSFFCVVSRWIQTRVCLPHPFSSYLLTLVRLHLIAHRQTDTHSTSGESHHAFSLFLLPFSLTPNISLCSSFFKKKEEEQHLEQ